MDYDEPEEPAAFSLLEEESYSEEDDYPAQGDGRKTRITIPMIFPPIRRRAVDSLGGKRSQMFSGGGAPPQGEQEYRRWQPPTRRS